MGCDIHLYKEKFVDGKWVAADAWAPYDYGDDDKGIEVPHKNRYTGRNYNLFGLLSKGVRRDHPFSFEPRGLPFDACDEVKACSERWGVDGHNHSYLYLHELKAMLAFLKSNTIQIEGMKNRDELKALRDSIVIGQPNWDLLFPYCQSTNDPRQEEFSIAVPATFYVGGALQEIIDGFDGVEGENHRIVFFFDN